MIELIIDLIDTQWNVNLDPESDEVCFAGFNRYIVECKSLSTVW